MKIRFALTALLVTCFAINIPQPLEGQLPRKLKDAKKVVENKAQKPPADTATSESPQATSDASTSETRADPKVWENYDFVPGSKVLFYTDFSEDKVGNFARGLKYRSGPTEVVERDGVKVLRATGRSEFLIPVGGILPERFTLEIDVIAPLPRDGEHDMHEMLTFEGGSEDNRGAQSAGVVWMPSLAWIQGGGQSSPASNVTIPTSMRPLLRSHAA